MTVTRTGARWGGTTHACLGHAVAGPPGTGDDARCPPRSGSPWPAPTLQRCPFRRLSGGTASARQPSGATPAGLRAARWAAACPDGCPQEHPGAARGRGVLATWLGHRGRPGTRRSAPGRGGPGVRRHRRAPRPQRDRAARVRRVACLVTGAGGYLADRPQGARRLPGRVLRGLLGPRGAGEGAQQPARRPASRWTGPGSPSPRATPRSWCGRSTTATWSGSTGGPGSGRSRWPWPGGPRPGGRRGGRSHTRSSRPLPTGWAATAASWWRGGTAGPSARQSCTAAGGSAVGWRLFTDRSLPARFRLTEVLIEENLRYACVGRVPLPGNGGIRRQGEPVGHQGALRRDEAVRLAEYCYERIPLSPREGGLSSRRGASRAEVVRASPALRWPLIKLKKKKKKKKKNRRKSPATDGR